MDVKELDKKQLILLTLLITFVVSIATGIVTVSLMNQMPKSVPQTINNVIQKTIERVTTVEVPVAPKDDVNQENLSNKNDTVLLSNGQALISIYKDDNTNSGNEEGQDLKLTAIGQGIIISDVGLILIDSNIVKEGEPYKVILDTKDFSVSILKRFENGFTVLKMFPYTNKKIEDPDTTTPQ